ncbi:MAG: UDP-N-acetylmuramoyl-tripeptide--D-alanyl-D-alanine ligase [Spirochaetaceae bacterium]|jgi:UDP-N-acetylmuramoyl-tripeptide--D-alanyl-D-alanine ligase|nr:UDP-N-acetylmuramoyl-tripeptide--D-alanyl-D-alanine ligase [Spirochaetaceae bacterium]
MLMTFNEAAALPGFELLPGAESGMENRGFDSVCVDSREIVPGALFVALPGEKTDGHAFVKDAFAAGAAGALVERAKRETYGLTEAAREAGKSLVLARDTLRGLQALAAAYLDRFPAMLKVGITGSSGKTTTKELAAAMIGAERSVVFNGGNLNSDSGLPLSVFHVRSGHEVGIFEMGMNRKGEIAELAAVLRPDIALITNTGSAHIGMIGSERGIALEKRAVFSRFTGKELALLPEGGAFSELLAEELNGRLKFFGKTSSKKFGGAESRGLFGSTVVWDGESVNFALPGEHNLMNALAAAALADAAGVSGEAVRAGLAGAKPLFGRGEVIAGEFTVLRDCYNANPDSMDKAISLCDEADWDGRRVYIIGSMLELGDGGEAAHEALGERLAESKADIIFLFGEETKASCAKLKDTKNKFVFHTNSIDDLRSKTRENIRKGDMILLKGSRACALERVMPV